MKKNKIIWTFLIIWALVLCVFMGKILIDKNKAKENNNGATFNGVVGGKINIFNHAVTTTVAIDDNLALNTKTEKTQTTKDINTSSQTVKEVENKTLNEEKTTKTNVVTEKNIVFEKYGTVIYDEITYEIIDDEKVKKSSERKVDASKYDASVEDLLKEASNLVSDNKKIYEEVVNYTNAYRKEVSNKDLILDDKLTLIATFRALEMAYTNNFSHERLDGSYVYDLAKDLKISYHTMGENIAYGYPSSESVTVGWRNSEGHYKNMINKEFNKIGVGMFKFNGNIYWVQVFSD